MSDEKDGNIVSPSEVAAALCGIEVRKAGYSLYVFIPDNGLECRCSYVPHEQGSMLTHDELVEILSLQNVLEGIDQEAFDDFVISAAAGRPLSNVLVASGAPPVDGTDEYFVQTVPSTTVIRDKEDDFSSIDMHMVQTFVNVLADEEIGRIIPAGPGTPGRNIKGLPIPQQPGKPLKYKIGKNIHIEEDGTLLAAATGRFCQVGGQFSVEEEYVVEGDVNFRVGNINFNGFVEVHGDVRDNFNITASKGLTVTGNIGVCRIVSEGDITICGMDGDDKGSLVCGGTLRAHFIHNTSIECAGDVIVDVEIHNCTIRTLGRIVVNKDTISGGSCIAQGGIEANKLGSPSGRPTSLIVGVDYRYVEKLITMLDELTELQDRIREASSLDEATGLRKIAASLNKRTAEVRGKAEAAANAKINVKATLHENVRMGLGAVSETVRLVKDGPLTIVENIIDGGLRFIPMTSLDVKARDIEQAYVRDRKLAMEAMEAGKIKLRSMIRIQRKRGSHVTHTGNRRPRTYSHRHKTAPPDRQA